MIVNSDTLKTYCPQDMRFGPIAHEIQDIVTKFIDRQALEKVNLVDRNSFRGLGEENLLKIL